MPSLHASVAHGREESPLDQIRSRLSEPFSSALISMYTGEPQLGADGLRHELDAITRLDARIGLWLYESCLKAKPTATLDIGLAYGFSTLFILAALAKNGAGHHTAVDPYEHELWHGVGIEKVKQVGMEGSCRIAEDYCARTTTDLAREGQKFDLILIDGDHRFDSVLVDFTLCSGLCAIGGQIILDDMWMPAVRTAAAFVRTNRRDFEELPTPLRQFAVFRRKAPDTREWYHFKRFRVGRRSLRSFLGTARRGMQARLWGRKKGPATAP